MKSLIGPFIGIVCCITIVACSQNNSSNTNLVVEKFIGGTPCNPTVNSALRIPISDTCEDMTWELIKSIPDSSFKLSIAYGAYLPNTMYFLNGGKSMSMTGKLKTTSTMSNGTRYKILHLVDKEHRPDILFIEMDNNILHLIDTDMKLIKGEAGMAFLLNRVNSAPTK
ncbi:MAG: hypothetical protein ABIR66_08785 [Saprospiraceae bacterium]